jgi:hypothetical protein
MIATLTYMSYNDVSVHPGQRREMTIRPGGIVWAPFTGIRRGQPLRSALRIAFPVDGHA